MSRPPCCAVQEHADLVEHLARGEATAAVSLMLRYLGANEARLDGNRRDEPQITPGPAAI